MIGSTSARRRPAALVTILAAALAAAPADAREGESDYRLELARIDREIASAGPAGLVYWLHARASLTTDLDDLERLEREIERAMIEHRSVPPDELYLYRATLQLELHRLAAAGADLDRLSHRGRWSQLRLLRADLAQQEGRYDVARRTYDELLAEDRTWDRLARVAHHEWRTGESGRADALYQEAQAQLTAKEMRRFAWIELQRGLIDLDGGEVGEALAHYRRADRAFSGYWLIEEHLAEALDLSGRPREAEALYRRVVGATGKPEFVAALARIVARRDPAAARALQRRADELFEEGLARYPEATLGHYLEHLIGREPPAPRLLELAERNHRLRPNAESKLLLAEVHLRLGQAEQARALLDEIAASEWRSPELERLRARLER